MIILLSPAKTLDMAPANADATQPRLLDKSEELIKKLRRQSRPKLQKLMHISESLADLNYQRYQDYHTPFSSENATPAGFAFKGDVYQDLEYQNFDERERKLANQQIRILSGLYGLLRPSDLIQAYRLEMGTKLPVQRKKNLYEFWGDQITELINEDLAATKDDTVLNLASQEYFKSVNTDKLAGRLLTAHFKEERDGKYKVIAFNAKKARGRLAQLITLEGLTTPEGLPELSVNGYTYNAAQSTENDWVWTK